MTSLRLGKSLLLAAVIGAAFAAPYRLQAADDPFAVNGALTSRAVFSCTELTMSNGTIDSAGITSNTGSNHGDVASTSNIRMSGNALIKGNAVAGPNKTFTLTGNASITGTKTNATTVENCIPIDLTDLVTSVKATNDNAKIPLTDRGKVALGGTNHTDFSMSGQDSITIPPGTYYFTSITLSGGATIKLTGSTHILVNGKVTLTGGSVTNPNPFKLHLWVAGSGPVSLSGGASVTAFIYAPSASASLSNANLTGSLFANSVSISGPSQVRRAVDDALPSVAITSPADGAIVPDPAHVLVKGTASDDETGVASVQVNGHNATLNADGTWQITLDLTGPSPATITAVATDFEGNIAKAKISVITALPPVLTLTSPANGSILNVNVVDISGSAGNATSVTVNGQPATIAGGVFTVSHFNLGADGTHALTITGTSPGGSSTITPAPVLTVDTTKPTITATLTPLPNANDWNNSNVTVKFNCDDTPGTGIKTCTAPVTLTTEGHGLTVSGTAVDNAGNSKTITVTVNIDKTNPVLSITSNKNNDIVTTPQVTITGYADDATTVFVNGVAATVDTATATFTSAPITLSNGNNSISVTGTDPAGNSGTVSITLILDTIPPKVSITSPADGTVVPDPAHVTVTGTASDDQTSVASVQVNGHDVTLDAQGNFQTVLDLTGLSPAVITAVAKDAAGNSYQTHVTVTPIPPPVLSLTSPQPGSYVNTRVVTLSGGAGTATSVTVNGQAATVSNGAWTLPNFDLGPDGIVTLNIVGRNGGGSTPLTQTVGVDTVPPTIKATVTPTPNGAGWNNTDVVVSFLCDDTGSKVKDCPAPLTLTNEGPNQVITKTATDFANNTSAPVVVTVNIDKTKPTLKITSHTDGQIVTNPTVTISGTIDEPVTATVDNVAATVDTTAKTFTSAPITLVDGSNTITVAGKDVAGNSSTPVSITLIYDATPPSISITSPADNSLVSDPAHVLVKGTASDPETPFTIQVNGVPTGFASDGTFQTTVDVSGSPHAAITAVATDAAGRTGTAQITVTTIPPPVLTLSSPADGAFVNTSKVDLTGGAGNATSVTVNGQPASVAGGIWTVAGFDLGADGSHPLTIIGTNPAGSVTLTPLPVLISDTVRPVIQASLNPVPNAAGWNNTDVTVTFNCTDGGSNPSGIATCPAPVTLTSSQSNVYTATDKAGNSSTPLTVTVNIDKVKPVLTIASHRDNQILTDPRIVLSGAADDAVNVSVNGVPAAVYASNYTSAPLTLVEGSNTITVTGSDLAGNVATPVTITLVVDTRAPQLAITSPAANACLNATSVDLRGTVADPHVQGVNVLYNGITVAATVDGSGNWSATVANLSEGAQSIAVTATDSVGHTATVALPLRIDRTAPVISVTENGSPFTATLLNRPVALFVHADDASPNVTLSAKLDGADYASGTSISLEGPHTLVVTATDCAGNAPAPKTVQFTIDRTPPALSNFTPGNGQTVGTVPTALSGLASEAATVSISGTSLSAATDPTRHFTIAGVPFADGQNSFTVHAVDAAGNGVDVPYSLTVRSNAPVIDISDNGAAITSGALFNRALTPVIRVTPSDATFTATLDGGPFTSGNAVTAETPAPHTLTVNATDSLGHTAAAAVTFTIDTHGPAITITSPAAGAVVTGDQVTVTGNAGDSVSLTVNGVPATPGTNGAFSVSIPLEAGENLIVATGRDRAGNSGTASVTVTRSESTSGLIITYPLEPMLTNHTATLVTGRVLTPSDLQTLTIEGHAGTKSTGTSTVSSDPSGTFRVTDLPLFEGVDTITVTATSKSNTTTSAVVHVTTDLTPPSLAILAGADPLKDGFTYPSSVVLSVSANDPGSTTAPATTMQVDDAAVTLPYTVTATGGHSVVAVATDTAHNETRVTRTFYIGSTAAAGCSAGGFDPASGAVVTTPSVTLVGTTGGAAGIFVNNIAASVASGMFRATVELPLEGPNTVSIACADASGNKTNGPTITLTRVTNAPSVTIDAPSEMTPFGTDSITVSGTVSAGVASVDVNGTPAVVAGTTWGAANVRLSAGLNILVAHAANAAGRIATASRRVLYLQNAPAITVTWPNDGFATGAAQVDVSGTYTNLDPATLQVSGGAGSGTLETHPRSDTTGSFLIHGVALASGAQALTVTGRDALSRSASAVINVTRNAGTAAVSITSPLDNTYLPAGAASTVAVSGTYVAVNGSQLDINGNAGTLTPSASLPNSGTFSGSAAVNASGTTPIVVRLTQPDGTNAVATALVTKLGAAPSVKLTFPAAEATSVDPGVVVLVSFSAPMDETSLRSAFSLVNSAGTPVTGQFRLDKDVLSFAAAATLTPGDRYTIDVKTTATDVAGNALDKELVSSFTVATTAPSAAPQVNAITAPVCGSSVTISGTAAAGARVEVDYAGAALFTTADATTGVFSQLLAISSQSGFAVARVRVVGADGTLSPAAEVPFQVDCSGPQVAGATYDRTANSITITFSRPIDLSTVTVGTSGSVQLSLGDGTPVTGTAAAGASSSIVVITPGTPDPRTATLVLLITSAVKDTTGHNLTAFTQTFTVTGDTGSVPSDGYGYITGQIIDATTGRPLAGATVTIDVPVSAVNAASRWKAAASSATSGQRTATGGSRTAISGPRTANTGTTPFTTITDTSGAYTDRVPEGAFAIHAYARGYTDVWRQVVVPAGQGVVPIDIRLTAAGPSATMASADFTLDHGGDSPGVTRHATLSVSAGAVVPNTVVTLTAVGAQGISGLPPLGWSPLAAAEVRVTSPVAIAAGASAARLTFQIDSAAVAASGKVLTAVEYDSVRDEWHVLQPAVATTGNAAQVNITLPATQAGSGANLGSGEIALVYPDAGTGVTAPTAPVGGGVLTGVSDLCADGHCPAMQVAKAFNLNPTSVPPTGSTVATLTIDTAGTVAPPPNPFPSGTAVDAVVNEQLTLTDGTILADVPYATDLVLYRSLAGDTAVADFKLAPSAKAANVPLQIGVDHIQIVPYPGRLDRGTLIGPAGGHVPSDANVQVDIPTGAATVALHATAKSMTAADLAGFGSIDGFQIVSGLTLTLETADTTTSAAPVQLLKPAATTFVVNPAQLGTAPQLILAEVLPATSFGRMVRLADRMGAAQPIESTTNVSVTTATIDPAVLPVEGVVRAGQYLLLKASQPIAYAFGGVRVAGGAYINGAEVVSATLGVRDLSRVTGIFAVPVVATPAAPFALTPVHPTAGEGATHTAAAAPAAGAIVNAGDLLFAVQAPTLQQVTVTGTQGGVNLVTSNGATGITLSTGVQAVFSQTIDATSVNNSSIVVTNTATRAVVPGSVTAAGSGVTWTPTPNPSGQPLVPNATYVVSIAASIKGSHGAPLGTSQTFAFSTVTQISNGQVHPERIRITIPDANGISTIAGDAGALATVPPEPQAWRAVALRRGNAFITQYQVTANSDGSFQLRVGTCSGATPCADAITIKDHIDLEVLNAAGNIAAIIPLTPFSTPDGQGFIAPTDVDTTFTSKDGVGVHVPAGAFAQLTTVTVARLDDDSAFSAVPSIHDDMNFYRGVNLTLDCTTGGLDPNATCEAAKRLDVTIPVPANAPTDRNFLLGWLGDSVRGPRIMIVDTLRVDNGNFTTASAPSGTGQSVPRNLAATSAKPASSKVSKSSTPGPSSRKAAQSNAPVISSFGGLPLTILSGDSSTLSWTTTGADHVTITSVPGNLPPTGTFTVKPASTTTYTLTAFAADNSSASSDPVTVKVNNGPVVDTFKAVPDSIAPGGTSTLTWTTSTAAIVKLHDSAGNDFGSQPLNGSLNVSPVSTVTYTLIAYNSDQTVQSAPSTVQLNVTTDPVITSFTATPESLVPGQASTLAWKTINTNSISIKNDATGSVVCAGGAISATPSTCSVSPLSTASYTLTAVGSTGAKVTQQVVVRFEPPGIGNVVSPNDVKAALVGIVRSGRYNVLDLRSAAGTAVGWSVMTGIQGNYDMFWDSWNSLFASHLYLSEPHGVIVIPVLLGKPFQVVGYDATSGLQAFSKAYDPLPIGTPGAAYYVPPPSAESQGPYPVSASPFRVAFADITVEDKPIETVSGLVLTLHYGHVTIKDAATSSIPDKIAVTALNLTSGTQPQGPAVGSATPREITIDGKLGDRILLIIGAQDVDPQTQLSITFDKAIATDANTSDPDKKESAINSALHGKFKVEKQSAPPATGGQPPFQRIDQGSSDIVWYTLDSGDRRITINLPAALEAGATYRITIPKDLHGASDPLQIGVVKFPNDTTSQEIQEIPLSFTVRPAPQPMSGFNLPLDYNQSQIGTVHDMALNGNVLLLATLQGGILAYDVSDPGSMNSKTSLLGYVDTGRGDPTALANSQANSLLSPSIRFWSVASDHHGRVYTSAIGSTFGFIQAYRLDDFIPDASHPAPRAASPLAAAVTSWAPGYGASLDIGSDSVLSDRPEGIPRKLQIVLQDNDNGKHWNTVASFTQGVTDLGGNVSATAAGDFSRMQVTVPIENSSSPQGAAAYPIQRITIENMTRQLRWSADAKASSPAVFSDVVAKDGDQLRVIFNERTYGIVTIFGYGVGIFDLNAMEANALDPSAPKFAERIRITQGTAYPPCDPLAGCAESITDLSLSADATLLSTATVPGAPPELKAYGLDIHRGVLDLKLIAQDDKVQPFTENRTTGFVMVLPTRPHNTYPANHIKALVEAIQAANPNAIGPDQKPLDPASLFVGVQPYHWTLEAADNKALGKASLTGTPHGARGSSAGTRVERDYLLVPANALGLLVIDATNPATWLDDPNLADVIWLPAGAAAVRVIPGMNRAIAVDRDGRVLLIDLSRLDGRYDPNTGEDVTDPLFKTVAACLKGQGTYGLGAPDPRILWTSEPGLVNGNIIPVIDPDTGILFTGKAFVDPNNASDAAVKAIPAIDPHIEVLAEVGANSMRAVGGVVPLGIDPPANILDAADSNASLGAFRLRLTLPGGMPKSLNSNQLRLAVESERVPGGITPQTLNPYPPAHLRMADVAGKADPRASQAFILQPDVPSDPQLQAKLRLQSGYNRFISPWIVAVADPRALAAWDWANATSSDKTAAGCKHCDRPDRLKPTATNLPQLFEIWSAGRNFLVRPEACLQNCSGNTSSIFAGTPYAYLGQSHRLELRVPTVMADIIRPTAVVVAGQNPPVAGGALQETTYLHSGEVESSAVDLNVGGRNGHDVVVGRTSRSRTLGSSELGFGWTSALFAHIRTLPNGSVEYYDGLGNIWTYKPTATPGLYKPPAGFGMQLTPNGTGWMISDSIRSFILFDEFGRQTARTDEYASNKQLAGDSAPGNIINFLYDVSGRLSLVSDPVGRATTFTFWPDDSDQRGLLQNVKDWRKTAREIEYDFDPAGRLNKVQLPKAGRVATAPNVPDLNAVRPKMLYNYESATPPAYSTSASSTFNAFFETAPEIDSIIDPAEAAGSMTPRVAFQYDHTNDPNKHDRVTQQFWPCGSYTSACAQTAASFSYTVTGNDATVQTTDMLGQPRTYTLKKSGEDGWHTMQLDVPTPSLVDEATSSNVPSTASPSIDPQTHAPVVLTTGFQYDGNGQLKQANLPDGTQVVNTYEAAASSPLGRLATSVVTAAGHGIHTAYQYQSGTTVDTILDKVGKAMDADPKNFREANAPSRSQKLVKQEDTHQQVKMTSAAVFDLHGQKRWDEAGGPNLVTAQDIQQAANATTVAQLPNPAASTTSQQKLDYYDNPSDPNIRRGRVKTVTSGRDNQKVTAGVTYSEAGNSNPGGQIVETTDERNVKTTEELDAWDRLVHRTMSGAAGSTSPVNVDEVFGYDADGRVVYTSENRTQASPNPALTIETFTSYDVMGRVIETHTTNAKVNDSDQTLYVTRSYDLAARVSTQTDPGLSPSGGDAFVQSSFDTLGRTVSVVRNATGAPQKLKAITGYDTRGRKCYATDGAVASLHRFDGFGREIDAIDSYGIRTHRDYDEWDQLKEQTTTGGTTTVAHTAWQYTDKGNLFLTGENLDGQRIRSTSTTLSDNGLTEVTAVGETDSASTLLGKSARMVVTKGDLAGRTQTVSVGNATFLNSDQTPSFQGTGEALFSITDTFDFDGSMQKTVRTTEPQALGKQYVTKTEFDMLRHPSTLTEPGAYKTTSGYDEAGNLLTLVTPGQFAAELMSYDARNLLVDKKLRDGSSVHHTYDALGNPKSYKDEEGATTSYTTDLLGRITTTTYPGGTTEEHRFEDLTGRVHASRDRAGQWLVYQYDAGGHVTFVTDGGKQNEPSASGANLIGFEYDAGGRLTAIRNPDSAVEFDSYDLLGRPGVTRSVRYRNGTGLSQTRDTSDVHVQGHTWSVYGGERTRWRMPAAASSLTNPETTTGPWRTWIDEVRDGVGNIANQSLAISGNVTVPPGAPVTSARARNAGRLIARNRFGASATTPLAVSGYGYDDQDIGGNGTSSGLLTTLSTQVGTATLAGSSISRYPTKQISVEDDLGLGKRRSVFHYNSRERLDGSHLDEPAVGDPAPLPIGSPYPPTPTPADFRTARATQPAPLDNGQLGLLGALAKSVMPFDWTALQATDGSHQIASRTLSVGGNPQGSAIPYAFTGGRRTTSGNWTSTYDQLGRLTSLELAGDRHIDFTYDPNDRIVGRSAKQSNGQGGWSPETRAAVLAADGLPADVTFVWDPLVDRLVAVYQAGASIAPPGTPITQPTDPNAGLLQQYLHGDQGMDDPVDVLVASTPGGTPTEYFPIVDEAGAGSLQAVLNSDGTLAERVLYADAFGDAPHYLQGGVVDKVTFDASTGGGSVSQVTVTAHFSEKPDPATLASGLRLASVKSDASVAAVSAVAPQVSPSDPSTVTWTLSNTDWQALTSAAGADSIEVDVTNALRFAGWGATPVQPAPQWTSTLYSASSTTATPVIVRERISYLTQKWSASGPTLETAYDIPSLYLAASPQSKTRILTGWKAAPFVEPASGFAFFRARWYDPSTGTWLTADPMGYKDSSNLYAFCHGDPVGCKDSEGLADPKKEETHLNLGHATSIGAAPPGDPSTGFWYWLADTATMGYFSLPGGTYRYLGDDEPYQSARDLRAFRKEHPKEIFLADTALALTGKGKALKIIGLVGAHLTLWENARLSKQPPAVPVPPGPEPPKPPRNRRAPILADNDVMVHALEKGDVKALDEIRAGKTYITPNQYHEFMNVTSQAQRKKRLAFMNIEGIEVLSGERARELASLEEFQAVFAKVAPIMGRNDAALAAFAKVSGFEAVTKERRLYQFLTQTLPKLAVPIRRIVK